MDQRPNSICTHTLMKVEASTSHSSMKPALAPSVVAVSSSPEPTTAAEVIMPGPRNLNLSRQRVGGSWMDRGSNAYGSMVSSSR
jgi:hypothetical protein